MNEAYTNALRNNRLAARNPLESAQVMFPIGTKVKICHADYNTETATVQGHKLNSLGSPLVKVKLDDRDSTPVFYVHELEALPQ